MLAKDMGAKKVAVKLTKVNYNKDFLDRLGIDLVFHPEAAAAGYLEEMLTKPDVLDLAFLNKGNAEILEIQITKESKLFKKHVKDFAQEDSSIIGIFDAKGNLIIPKPSTELKEGYKALILAQTNKAKEIRKKLK
jgi:trk system potassium uptake protein TrkA